MARIRTIKPSFFRHEDLQDLERDNPGKYVMLVFAGLWGHCDKAGRFEWNPRMLKLDILPFLDFSLADTLNILLEDGFLTKYEVAGKTYGFIPTFLEHQRISGKEAQDPAHFPDPPTEQPVKQPGSAGEASETAGREGNGVQEGNGDTPDGDPVPRDDIQKAFDNYNVAANEFGLPLAEKLTPDRRKRLKLRLSEHGGLPVWNRALEAIGRQPFLTGTNDRKWKASLDFLLQAESFNKVLEGHYG